MKTLAYGAFLVLLLIASVVLLRSIEPSSPPGPPPRPSVSLERITADVDLDRLQSAGAQELYDMGVEFMQVWRPREATVLFERAVQADSTYHPAWIQLIECYAHPLVAADESLLRAAAHAEQTSPEPSDRVYVDALRALFAEHDYDGAVATLSALMGAETSPADAPYHLALAYYRLGRLQEAAKYLEPLLAEDPTVAPVVELYIRRAVAAREYERAADAARELTRMYAEEPFPYVLSAQVELAREKPDAAVEFCDNALELDAKCVPAIMTRACLYAEAGELESARVSFEKLLLFDAETLRSIGHEGVAFADFLMGDFDAAVSQLDESTRHAMLTGATQRGLALAFRHVEYLCQLGQADAAEGVIERWLTGFGEVPVSLAKARVELSRGRTDATNKVLARLSSDPEWLQWSRKVGLDAVELRARVALADEHQPEAAALLKEVEKEATAIAPGWLQRRTFLAGLAAFDTGDAEGAAAAFTDVRRRLYGDEFPYHGDPVVYVQAMFFLAEAELARGNRTAAQTGYESFLALWEDAAWKLDAVDRARRSLDALGGAVATPQ